MITSLSIQNFALIENLKIDFKSGFSIITGETGAGKSILLGGLSLVLGKRADTNQIKDKSKKCVVEAIFDIANYDLKPIFDVNDLDYDPNTIIRREILPSGKSRAFVNDTPVNLETVNQISSHLIDIHSQHQTLELIKDSYQFNVIDALANNKELLNTYTVELKTYRNYEQQLSELRDSLAEAKREYDYNLFLLNELVDADLKKDELKDLESSYEQLSNVETINEVLSYTKSLLDNEDLGVLERLSTIKRELSKISEYGDAYASIEQRIESVSIELKDLLIEMDALEGKLSSDPEELAKVNNKLQTINSLMHKHSAIDIAELIKIRDDISEKVSVSENIDNDIVELESKVSSSVNTLNKIAVKLRENRQKAIPEFIEDLEAILTKLGMSDAKFNIELSSNEEFKFNGKDDLVFLFKANKGGNFVDLKKSASGGELSRIMLAVKSILANYIKLPTLMFDEIDTGVSGEISDQMGNIMKGMSKRMQIFSITHLPQIASKGNWHYKVYKTDDNNVTHTQMRLLTTDERIVELAQMLGGSNITESAIAHAKQLLN